MQTREERDTMGVVEVPAEALWGAQTQRSLQNFKISNEHMPTALIHALAKVKRAAAKVNHDLGLLNAASAAAIIEAADEVIAKWKKYFRFLEPESNRPRLTTFLPYECNRMVGANEFRTV